MTASVRDARKGRGSDVAEEEEPPAKKSRTSGGSNTDITANGNTGLVSPNITPTRQSRRIASMTPNSDEVKKKLKRT